MLTDYRFSINGRSVNPIYKDELSLDYEKEKDQYFFRANLSGNIAFIRDDFDWIKLQPFQTEFIFLIERNNNSVWEYLWEGTFFKTDCKFDDDDRKIDVKMAPKDLYKTVLAGLQKEYNVTKLAPAKTPVEISKRPLIQIYSPGDSVIGCFLSGNAWEQDVSFEVTSHTDLINKYFFSLSKTIYKTDLAGDVSPENSAGGYTGSDEINMYKDIYKIERKVCSSYIATVTHGLASDFQGSLWVDGNGNIWVLININSSSKLLMTALMHDVALPNSGQLTYVKNGNPPLGLSPILTYSGAASGGTFYRTIYAVRLTSNQQILFYSKNNFSTELGGDIYFMPADGSGTMVGQVSSTGIYARYLLDVDTIQGLNTYALLDDDIVANNRNYKRAIGFITDQIISSTNMTETPTEFGLSEPGMYFQMPYYFGIRAYPIARSTWGKSSLWFRFSSFDWILEQSGRKAYQLRDTSLISDVIKVLLNEIAPGIKHEPTEEYSQFLSAEINPVTYNKFKVFITQKSNITAGEYDRPAEKAPATLASIMDMLKNTFQLYWYLDGDKFKIEHVSFFKNGGTYLTPIVGTDLTELENIRNRKKWAFSTSKYEFEKEDMPARIECGWMDDVSEGFEGVPVVINSKYVQDGKIEEVKIGGFTTDIDYMIMNPSAINNDGFALFAAILQEQANLFNKNTIVEGVLSSGNVVANSSYYTSDFISVKPNTLYQIKNTNHIAFYTNAKTYISPQLNAVTSFITPSNCEYLRMDSNYAGVPPEQAYLIEGDNIEPVIKLPFVNMNVSGAELRLQNGIMSWPFLQSQFWRYDMPAYDVNINGNYAFIQGIKRLKKQTVTYPSGQLPDLMKLVRTNLGDGEINKLSVNLSSRMNQITLKYDTE